VTIALALWGAVLSTVLAIVQVVKAWRERPRLTVRSLIRSDTNGSYLGVSVVNKPGSLTTTIVTAGLEIARLSSIEKVGEAWEDIEGVARSMELGLSQPQPPIPGYWLQILVEGVHVVEPGHHKSFEIAVVSLPRPLDKVDDPVRPFATDIEGRTIYGPARPLFRELIDGGWHPTDDPDPVDPFHSSTFRMAQDRTLGDRFRSIVGLGSNGV
jgi:hypothetical protein